MKTIYLRVYGHDLTLETGAIVLREHLEDKGYKVVRKPDRNHDAIVCWGCSTRDLYAPKPALNAHVGMFNKYQALLQFKEAGAKIPKTLKSGELDIVDFPPGKGPWFGRNMSHAKGKDIKIFETWKDVIQNGNKDFYTLYVPHEKELRVWTFKDEAFAVYHKHYKNPGLDNYKNLESRSELRDDLLAVKELTSSAVKATKALKMDFGAVDILEGKDGHYYVLEVNSMPDISSLIRVSGIRLADRVSKWVEKQ